MNGIFSQKKSIHFYDNFKYNNKKIFSEKEWDNFNDYQKGQNKNFFDENCELEKIVFGWFPYWMGTSYNDLNFSLLSDIAYFSYEVNANTGNYDNIHYWKTTNLIDIAHENNCRVSLTATLFSGHANFFNNEESVQTLIDSLISLVQYRNVKGINIDFESVPSSQKDNLTNFVIKLSNEFHEAVDDAFLSIAVPAVDWNDVFDVSAMRNYIDLFLIMAYEYHWRGGDYAGPNSPKNNGQIWSPYDATRSVNKYLSKGAYKEKLALAIPYYGYDWKTENDNVRSETVANGVAKTFANVMSNLQNYDVIFEEQSSNPYYVYQNNSDWHQCWYDDKESLSLKYDMVNMRDIAGIGIWALSYDGSHNELWEAIQEKFTDCRITNCQGFFTDMGGKFGNYHNNEDYFFTISPENADSLTVNFEEFNVELNYDTLFIYYGSEINEDSLINFYTGENSPGIIKSYSGIMSFYFKSDGATTKSGWKAYWSCDYIFSDTKKIYFQDLKIYPNPFENKIFIENKNNKIFELEIFNVFGKRIFYKKNFNEKSLNLKDDLQKGIYFLSIKKGNIKKNFKSVHMEVTLGQICVKN